MPKEVEDMIIRLKPDLILLDAGDNKPESGFALCSKIKKTPEYLNIKVIVSTIIHDKIRVLDAGADLYLLSHTSSLLYLNG